VRGRRRHAGRALGAANPEGYQALAQRHKASVQPADVMAPKRLAFLVFPRLTLWSDRATTPSIDGVTRISRASISLRVGGLEPSR